MQSLTGSQTFLKSRLPASMPCRTICFVPIRQAAGSSGPHANKPISSAHFDRLAARAIWHRRSATLCSDSLGLYYIIISSWLFTADWMASETTTELETLRHDVRSLSYYDASPAATITRHDARYHQHPTEQHHLKVLTVVSVVGVPSTLVASMYGIISRTCPNWIGLGVIGLSGYPYALCSSYRARFCQYYGFAGADGFN